MPESHYLDLAPEELELKAGDALRRGSQLFKILDVYHRGRVHRAQCELMEDAQIPPVKREFKMSHATKLWLAKHNDPILGWDWRYQKDLARYRAERLQREAISLPSRRRLRPRSIWHEIRYIPGWGGSSSYPGLARPEDPDPGVLQGD